MITQCPFCPGMTALAGRHDVERILVDGRKLADGWTWTVDIITDLSDGHGAADTLDVAFNNAVREAVQ